MKIRALALLAGCAISALVMSAPAYAVPGPINGTNSVGANNVTVSPSGSFGVGTTFTMTGLVLSGSQTGDFATYVTSTPVSLTGSTLLALNGSSYSWNSPAVGAFSGLVTGTPILITNGAFSATLSVYVLGTFTPGTDFGGLFIAGAMSETISYTETINPSTGLASYTFSGTVASPPVPPPILIPEPMTLALLGTGLVGLGVIRRRRA